MKTKKIKPVKAWGWIENGYLDEIEMELKPSPDWINLTILPTSDYKAMKKEVKRFRVMEKISKAWASQLKLMDKMPKWFDLKKKGKL